MQEVKRYKITNIILILMMILLLFSVVLLVCQKWMMITFNHTNSLKGVVYVIIKGQPVHRGDLVGFVWQHDTQFYKKGITFVKIVSGEQGDQIIVKDKTVYLNNKLIGKVKEKGRDRLIDLTVTQSGVVPKDEYFVSTPNPDSLDSRYRMVGTIHKKYVIGRAYEIF